MFAHQITYHLISLTKLHSSSYFKHSFIQFHHTKGGSKLITCDNFKILYSLRIKLENIGFLSSFSGNCGFLGASYKTYSVSCTFHIFATLRNLRTWQSFCATKNYKLKKSFKKNTKDFNFKTFLFFIWLITRLSQIQIISKFISHTFLNLVDFILFI